MIRSNFFVDFVAMMRPLVKCLHGKPTLPLHFRTAAFLCALLFPGVVQGTISETMLSTVKISNETGYSWKMGVYYSLEQSGAPLSVPEVHFIRQVDPVTPFPVVPGQYHLEQSISVDADYVHEHIPGADYYGPEYLKYYPGIAVGSVCTWVNLGPGASFLSSQPALNVSSYIYRSGEGEHDSGSLDQFGTINIHGQSADAWWGLWREEAGAATAALSRQVAFAGASAKSSSNASGFLGTELSATINAYIEVTEASAAALPTFGALQLFDPTSTGAPFNIGIAMSLDDRTVVLTQDGVIDSSSWPGLVYTPETLPVPTIPEPASILLAAFAGLACALTRKRCAGTGTGSGISEFGLASLSS